MAEQAPKKIDLASVDHVMKTTRTVRLRLDLERSVPESLIEEAIEVALQAPTGANSQTWRFVVVTDENLRSGIADLYRQGAERYLAGETGVTRTGVAVDKQYPDDDPRQQRMPLIVKSAVHLIENLHRVPVHIMLFLENRFDHEDVFTQGSMWGSILPAAWSLTAPSMWAPGASWSSSSAAAAARSASRDPMIAPSPARASRRASPLPSGPVPPKKASIPTPLPLGWSTAGWSQSTAHTISPIWEIGKRRYPPGAHRLFGPNIF